MNDVRRACNAFLLSDGPRWRSQLRFARLAFTRSDAAFVIHFVNEQHQDAIHTVEFYGCTFEDDETVNFLKNGLATEALSWLEVRVKLANGLDIDGNAGGTRIRSIPHFPLLVELATILEISHRGLGDDSFGYVVDTILTTNGKQRLKELNVAYNNLSSNSLPDVSRLVQQSKLAELFMTGNFGLFDDQWQVQLFCNQGLKKAKYLKFFWCDRCRPIFESTAIAIAEMIADALTVNTSLQSISVELSHDTRITARIHRLLGPLLERNRQMSNLQHFLDGTAHREVTTPKDFFRPMLGPYSTSHPDLSFIYLALRHGTVGPRGGTINPLVVPIAAAMAEQERRRQRQQEKLQRRQRQQEQQERQQRRQRQKEQQAFVVAFLASLGTQFVVGAILYIFCFRCS